MSFNSLTTRHRTTTATFYLWLFSTVTRDITLNLSILLDLRWLEYVQLLPLRIPTDATHDLATHYCRYIMYTKNQSWTTYIQRLKWKTVTIIDSKYNIKCGQIIKYNINCNCNSYCYRETEQTETEKQTETAKEWKLT